jgi:hypothetical protein
MKKISMLFCAGVLMSTLGVAFVACNNKPKGPDNEEFPESGIKPALPLSAGETGSEADKEVTAFFDENLHRITQSIFVEDGELPLIDACVMINSVEELPKADWGGTPFEFQYPDIDFDAYTLIIGKHVTGGLLTVVSHSIVVEQEMVTMTIWLGDTGEVGNTGAIPRNVYYWGLYPKLSEKSIINITVTHEN